MSLEAMKLVKTMLQVGMPEYDINDALQVLDEAIEQADKQEPVMRRTTREEKIVRPGIYEVMRDVLSTTPPNVAAPLAAPVQEPPDDELTQALIERDETEAIADELAQAIAQITGADIGEHTSANCPWRRALDAAEDFLCHPPAAPVQEQGQSCYCPNCEALSKQLAAQRQGGTA